MICGLKARNEGVLAFSEEDEPCCHARGLITSSLGVCSQYRRGNYKRQDAPKEEKEKELAVTNRPFSAKISFPSFHCVSPLIPAAPRVVR